MAEAAGLVIGAVSLARLFTDCVDCFNYVRVGQTLEDEFPIYQTKLDVLQLRFSRWAQAITQLSTARSPAITDDIAPLVEKILKQIAKLFQWAREDAEDYADIEDQKKGIQDPLQTPKLAKVHVKLKAIVHRRQKTTKAVGLGDRVQWAIYKREEFTTLIVNVRTKMDDLETLIPASELRGKLVQMRLEDAQEVKSDADEEMKLVEESTKDVDPALGGAIEQLRSGYSYSKTEIGEDAKVQMGDSFVVGYTGPLSKAYYTFHDIRIGKNAAVSMGTLYGKTVFDKV